MAKKKRPKPERKRTWKQLWALVDRRAVVTAVVIALILGIPTAILGGKWLYDHYQERKVQRTIISQEIQHRIPVARKHVIDDVNLAKKYLDGVDPRFCLHHELEGVPLRRLLDDWQSAGGEEIGQEIDRLAAQPTPTPEQMQNLLTLLEKAFPKLGPIKEPAPPDAEKVQPTPDIGDKLPLPPLPTPSLPIPAA